MSDRASSPAMLEWKNGWPLVLTCGVGFSFLWVMTGSLSMFMDPIANEFGWSRTFISSGIAVASVTTALLSPFFGVVIDRIGPRTVAIPGVIVTALSIAAFSFANGSSTQWLALWFFYALVSISIKATVWMAAVARSFNRSQGLALGVTLCGTAFSQSILPILANWLINVTGWRTAFVWLGLGWGGITLLLTMLFMSNGAASAARSKSRGSAAHVEPGALPGLAISAALRDPALWRVAISTLLIMMLTIGFTVHQISILGQAGVSRTGAAILASVAGATGVAGKLVTGALFDRYKPNWTASATLASLSLSFAVLVYGVDFMPLLFLAMVTNGYVQGAKFQMVSSLTARYAGMRNYGAIFGVMNSAMACGAGAGPILAGLSYDLAGGYQSFLIFGAITSFFCAVLMFTLPRYPVFDEDYGKIHHSVA